MNAQRTRRPVGAALPGFEHIERVWDAHHNIWLAKLHPGDACVTASTEGLTTVLGSCIAACLRDVRTGVGGMNHFMLLPGPAAGSEDQHGTAAMAALVTAVLTHGCGERSRLELKLVGGCRLTQDAPDTAQRGLEFARAFAAAAQLTIVAEDIGGVLGREVVYWPGTGQLRIRKLRGLQALVAGRERDYGESLRALRAGADTEGGRVG